MFVCVTVCVRACVCAHACVCAGVSCVCTFVVVHDCMCCLPFGPERLPIAKKWLAKVRCVSLCSLESLIHAPEIYTNVKHCSVLFKPFKTMLPSNAAQLSIP